MKHTRRLPAVKTVTFFSQNPFTARKKCGIIRKKGKGESPIATYSYHFNRTEEERIPCAGLALYQYGEILFKPRGGIDTHTQFCYEISYVLAGEGVISTGATDHHVKEGDAVVSLPHEGHTIESSAASPMRMAFLGFDRPEGDSSFAYLFEELDRLFRGEEGRAVSLPGQAQHLFHLFSVLEGGAPFSTMLAGYLIAELLIALIWRYTESREVHYFPRLTDTALLMYDM